MAVHVARAAVTAVIADAQPVAAVANDSEPQAVATPTLNLLRASDIKPEPIDWLWPGFLAAGKLTLLGGAPGTGKTTIAMSMAATITRGENWPDGSDSPAAGTVVIWSGEDDHSDTLVPRLIVADADLNRVYFVAGIQKGKDRRTFDPATDLAHLRDAIRSIGQVRLLIIDSIVSAVRGDSHKNTEVRRALTPLVELAAEAHCSLLGITHFSKGTADREPLERITGSLAFGALARVVIVAATPQEDERGQRAPRIMVRVKSNNGPDGGGFEYKLPERDVPGVPGVSAAVVQWGQTIEGSARKLLASIEAKPDGGRRSDLEQAKQFLRELLAAGPLDAKTVKSDAEGAGHSWATVRRAQKSLGIKPQKDSMKGGWSWELPRSCSSASEDAQPSQVSIFDELEHLRPVSANPPPGDDETASETRCGAEFTRSHCNGR